VSYQKLTGNQIKSNQYSFNWQKIKSRLLFC